MTKELPNFYPMLGFPQRQQSPSWQQHPWFDFNNCKTLFRKQVKRLARVRMLRSQTPARGWAHRHHGFGAWNVCFGIEQGALLTHRHLLRHARAQVRRAQRAQCQQQPQRSFGGDAEAADGLCRGAQQPRLRPEGPVPCIAAAAWLHALHRWRPFRRSELRCAFGRVGLAWHAS